MSMQRARETVRSNRNEIVRQLGQLAQQAGTDVATLARALQAEIDAELGTPTQEEVEEDEGPHEVTVELSGTVEVTVSSAEELRQELARIRSAAEGFGVQNLDIYADSDLE